MRQLWQWMRGKKTYFVAGLTAGLAVLGYAAQAVDGAQALGLLTIAGGMVGLGDKLERHHAETLAMLDDTRQVLQSLEHKDSSAVSAAAAKSIIDANALASAVQKDGSDRS